MLKIIAAALGVVSLAGGVMAILAFSLVGHFSEWCPTSCGVMRSCAAPFTNEDICANVEMALESSGWEGEPIPFWFHFIETTAEEKHGFTDAFGREVTGTGWGAMGAQVGYVAGERVCTTALQHEARHIILGLQGHT